METVMGAFASGLNRAAFSPAMWAGFYHAMLINLFLLRLFGGSGILVIL